MCTDTEVTVGWACSSDNKANKNFVEETYCRVTVWEKEESLRQSVVRTLVVGTWAEKQYSCGVSSGVFSCSWILLFWTPAEETQQTRERNNNAEVKQKIGLLDGGVGGKLYASEKLVRLQLEHDVGNVNTTIWSNCRPPWAAYVCLSPLPVATTVSYCVPQN
jgi:hypothetical protein